jgi:hypothetical protein
MVRTIERAVMASGLNHSEKVLLVQLPKTAPITVIESFPIKKTENNLTELYFKSPRGIIRASQEHGSLRRYTLEAGIFINS